MRKLEETEFVGAARGFAGGLPRSEETREMFTYLQENYDPEWILEIGFKFGGSATWFLETFPFASLVSVDPMAYEIAGKPCWRLLLAKYPKRFHFVNRTSWHAIQSQKGKLKDSIGQFDFAFIDGDHSTGGVVNDIESIMKLQIPTILIDNMEVPDQQRAVSFFEKNLKFIKQFDYIPQKTDVYPTRCCRLYDVISYDF